MIGFVEGAVAGRSSEDCLIDVGGVGYRVSCSARTLSTLPQDGDRCRVWTHLHVRDDALCLFGFATVAEQDIFESLLTVAGVGPKVALQVCSAFSPEALRRALASEDLAAIAAVPGVGRKIAQRVIVDLKDKMSFPSVQPANLSPDAASTARSALENLGYSTAEATAALVRVKPSPDDRVEDILKSALKVLA